MILVDTAARTLEAFGLIVPCEIGRGGACAAERKREGDGCTPLGSWRVETVLFTPGRAAPVPGLALPWRWIDAADGWSDDPADPAYNRPVRQPHRFSAERLLRQDGLYDIVVTLDHNGQPPVPGLGSAIFLHCRTPGRATEGCVAIDREALAQVVARLSPGDRLHIR